MIKIVVNLDLKTITDTTFSLVPPTVQGCEYFNGLYYKYIHPILFVTYIEHEYAETLTMCALFQQYGISYA